MKPLQDTPASPRPSRARRREPERRPDAHPYGHLSYVRVPAIGEGRDFWAPRPSGSLLAHVVIAILERGDVARDRGVIVGMMGTTGMAPERPAGLSMLAGEGHERAGLRARRMPWAE